MTYCGDDIKRLIPQRYPFMMVDTLEQRDAKTAVTTLAVRLDNYFALPDGTLAETGLVEHMAQSCAALSSLANQSPTAAPSETGDGGGAPAIGLIGEVKHFTCHRRPRAGERLTTTINFGMSFGSVTLATGQTVVDDEPIAEVNLKIFIQ